MNAKPKLKIGLVFDDSLDSNDGVSQQVKVIGAWLSAQGHEVRYLVGETKLSNWAGGKVYSLAKNFSVKFNGNRLSIPLPANKHRIKEILAHENFDILHVMMPYSPFMSQRVINYASPGTIVVGTFHIFPSGPLAKIGGRLLRFWYGGKLRRFSQITSVSPAAQAYAKEAFKINSRVIPNAVEVARFKTNKTKKPDDKVKRIVFLGRLVKRKGCSQLIEAFARLQTIQPDAELVIAGDGPHRRRLEQMCQKLKIGDHVRFLGFIKESEKPSLLAGADIACFPSLYGESFGIVLIEAMAAGSRIVVGGNNPGYASVLGAQPELLVDPADTEGFSLRLHHLLKANQQTDELHRWQLQAVKRYDINIVGQQITDLYGQAIASNAKKSHN